VVGRGEEEGEVHVVTRLACETLGERGKCGEGAGGGGVSRWEMCGSMGRHTCV